jgi:hypothetical protein
MTGRDLTTISKKAIGEPAQGKHFKGSAMDRQCTGLSNAFGAPLEHDHLDFCQGQFAGEPQSNLAPANDHDIKVITHDQRSGS